MIPEEEISEAAGEAEIVGAVDDIIENSADDPIDDSADEVVEALVVSTSEDTVESADADADESAGEGDHGEAGADADADESAGEGDYGEAEADADADESAGEGDHGEAGADAGADESTDESGGKSRARFKDPAYNGLLPISLLAGLIGLILGVLPAILSVLILGKAFYPLFIAAPLLIYLFNSLLKGGRDIRAFIITAVFSFVCAYLTALAVQAALYTHNYNESAFQIPVLLAMVIDKPWVLPASASAYAYPLIFTALGVIIVAELLFVKPALKKSGDPDSDISALEETDDPDSDVATLEEPDDPDSED